MRILAIDPSLALGSDYFATVLGDVDIQKRTLFVRGAKRWHEEDLTKVENEIVSIVARQNVDITAIELNGVGSLVAKHLTRQGLNMRKIITTGRPPEEETERTRNKMVKEEMIAYLIELREQERIFFPQILDGAGYEHLRKLRDEWKKLQGISPRTGRGSTIYAAPRGENDDLIMALMILAFVAKDYLEGGGGNIQVANKKFYPQSRRGGRDREILGTGVPDRLGVRKTGESIYWP